MAEVVPTASTPKDAGPEHAEGLTLLQEVAARTAGESRLEMCIQCGTCGGSCPSAAVMDHTPRALFAMLKAFPLRLPSLTPMAVGMLTRKRMAIMPKRIKQVPQLQAILKRAKELEGKS